MLFIVYTWQGRYLFIYLFKTSRYINININISSIELKWDGKITKIWYDNEKVKTKNGVRWRKLI